MKAGLTIGELAKEVHLNPKMIRYCEELELLPKPGRSESGYRLYSKDNIERLQLVKRAKLIGLSLTETKEIVEYAIDGRCNILEDSPVSLVETKLNEIDQKIEDLIAFRENLRQYHQDLSMRLKSEAREEVMAQVSVSYQCIGPEVDSFRE